MKQHGLLPEWDQSITWAMTLYILSSMNYTNYYTGTLSTNLSSVVGVCKWFFLQLNWSNLHVSSLFIYSYPHTIYCTIYICRYEMLKLKKKTMTEVGFIDLNCVFKGRVTPYDKWRPQVEKLLFRFLDKNANKTLILFPYGFKWVWMSYAHFILLTPCWL